ncbi:MAG: polyhydroxyalkanoic acid system family protein [Bacteroidota bacterium]
MSTLDVSRAHTLGLNGARRAANAVADRLRSEFRATAAWDGDVLRVSARGVKGEIAVSESLVRVTARLGLAARPFRNLLRREIEQQLNRSLSQPA